MKAPLNPDDLACKDLVELLSDFIEGDLDPVLADGVTRHLATCIACVAYLDQLQEAIRLTGSLERADVPAPVMDALLDAFRHARG